MDFTSEAPQFNARKRKRAYQARQTRESNEIDRNDDLPEDESRALPVGPTRKPRKLGITFDGGASRVDLPAAMSIIVAPTAHVPVVRSDRFVPPVGRAMIVEDKHMSAFLDAKMAEIGSLHDNTGATIATEDEADGNTTLTSAERDQSAATQKVKLQPIPKKSSNPYRGSRRRQRPGPTAIDRARDVMVDEIMREGGLPVYDRTSEQAHTVSDNDDRDLAAAAAFRAEFLTSLEEKRHSKKPTSTSQPNTGPKLGGSRMARERMKAAEEQQSIGSIKR